jgi:hypothetical protein
MKRKLIIGTLAAAAFTVAAVVFINAQPVATETLSNTVQVSDADAEKPAHCNPSNCTPEQAAKCQYKGSEATAEAGATNAATKNCNPAKCSAENKTETATL